MRPRANTEDRFRAELEKGTVSGLIYPSLLLIRALEDELDTDDRGDDPPSVLDMDDEEQRHESTGTRRLTHEEFFIFRCTSIVISTWLPEAWKLFDQAVSIMHMPFIPAFWTGGVEWEQSWTGVRRLK